jgi:hypothetical protein
MAEISNVYLTIEMFKPKKKLLSVCAVRNNQTLIISKRYINN